MESSPSPHQEINPQQQQQQQQQASPLLVEAVDNYAPEMPDLKHFLIAVVNQTTQYDISLKAALDEAALLPKCPYGGAEIVGHFCIWLSRLLYFLWDEAMEAGLSLHDQQQKLEQFAAGRNYILERFAVLTGKSVKTLEFFLSKTCPEDFAAYVPLLTGEVHPPPSAVEAVEQVNFRSPVKPNNHCTVKIVDTHGEETNLSGPPMAVNRLLKSTHKGQKETRVAVSQQDGLNSVKVEQVKGSNQLTVEKVKAENQLTVEKVKGENQLSLQQREKDQELLLELTAAPPTGRGLSFAEALDVIRVISGSESKVTLAQRDKDQEFLMELTAAPPTGRGLSFAEALDVIRKLNGIAAITSTTKPPPSVATVLPNVTPRNIFGETPASASVVADTPAAAPAVTKRSIQEVSAAPHSTEAKRRRTMQTEADIVPPSTVKRAPCQLKANVSSTKKDQWVTMAYVESYDWPAPRAINESLAGDQNFKRYQSNQIEATPIRDGYVLVKCKHDGCGAKLRVVLPCSQLEQEKDGMKVYLIQVAQACPQKRQHNHGTSSGQIIPFKRRHLIENLK